MAFNTSFVATSMLLDVLTNGHSWNINNSDTTYISLWGNSGTPTPDTALATQAYGSGQWVSASYEVYGTGWAAGGVTLSSTALVNHTGVGGDLNYSAGNVSQAGTTLSGAYGCMIYDHTVNSGANYVICAIQFGGAYSTTAGTFAITWGTANSIASIWWIAT